MINSKPNIVIFASDAKHTSYLNSIISEAWDKVNVFYMICMDTQLRYPTSQPELFHINHNISDPTPTKCNSLNQVLPFKPDWLIVSRERWSPEDQIINEFKNSFGAKVALVEPNSAFINSINQFLESESKNRFLDNIDVFFDHSKFIKEQRQLLGFKGNSIVVGNPKFDTNLDLDENNIDALKKYYKVDPNKKQVLFFTLQNKFRYKLFDKFKEFKNNHPEYQYFVKPYPGEPFGDKRNEFFPKFCIDGVTPIIDETHIWGMLNICDTHVGSISSVMYPSFFLNKEVHEYSKEIGVHENLWDNSNIINNNGGNEDKIKIWLNTFGINADEFKKLTSKENILPMLKNNDKLWKSLEDLVYYREDILKMFDEFNDKQASKRIIEYLQNNEL